MLTAASYTAGDAFQAEKRTVFTREWLPLCHAAQIPASGDFVAQGVGGWPLFALRGNDGTARAFRNVCRHQQMQVVDKAAGNCAQLRCRYHGWSYDLAGRFAGAPDPVRPADPADPVHDLPPLPVQDVAGFLLVLLDPAHASAACAAAATGARERESLLALCAGLAYAGALTVDAGCNWKTWLESRLPVLEGVAGCWAWPLLLAHRDATGVTVEQLIPRTFLRTRVVFHRLGAPRQDTADEAAGARAACEALQAERAAGTASARSGLAGLLHERLAAALATDPGA